MRLPPPSRCRRLLRLCMPCGLAALCLAGLPLAAAQPSVNLGTAVAVRQFVGSGTTDMTVLGRGLGELVTTDLIGLTRPACRLRIVEWTRRADAIKDLERSQGPEFDPATVPKLGQLIQPDVFIDGQWSEQAGVARWNVQARDALTGELLAEDQGQIAADKVFDATEPLARRLTEKLCKLRIGLRISGRMDDATVQGVACGLSKPFEAVSPEVAGRWRFTPRSASAGSFSYTAADVGGVTGSGSGSYAVIRLDGLPSRLQLAGRGAIHSPLGSFSAEITESLALEAIPSCERVGNK